MPGKIPAKAPENQPAASRDTVTISNGKNSGKIWKKVKSSVALFTGGVGLASGAIGGGLMGAAVGTTGSAISGLLLEGITLTALTSAGLVGAGIGAAVFGISGMVGGYKFSEWITGAAKWVADKLPGGK